MTHGWIAGKTKGNDTTITGKNKGNDRVIAGDKPGSEIIRPGMNLTQTKQSSFERKSLIEKEAVITRLVRVIQENTKACDIPF